VGQTIWHDASEPKSGEADAVPAKAHVGDAAFTTMAQKRVPAFLIIADPLFTSRRVQLVTLAARHAIPAIYTSREFAEVGGLDELRSQPAGHLSPSQYIYRPHTQRR
jgi:hypothetical protein